MRKVVEWRITVEWVSAWASDEHPDPFANDAAEVQALGRSSIGNRRSRPEEGYRINPREATCGRFRGEACVTRVRGHDYLPDTWVVSWRAYDAKKARFVPERDDRAPIPIVRAKKRRRAR